jgi:hypothetical protein
MISQLISSQHFFEVEVATGSARLPGCLPVIKIVRGVVFIGACPVSCARCSSLNEAEFPTEMMIHFSGSDHHNNPGVMVFLVVLICLDRGASQFKMPTKELRVLRGDARSGAA